MTPGKKNAEENGMYFIEGSNFNRVKKTLVWVKNTLVGVKNTLVGIKFFIGRGQKYFIEGSNLNKGQKYFNEGANFKYQS